ncbi:hypothetical protein SacxiDRAFT_3517 [Saccharomonospora xinjiangensis XJ-54]|uniref:Uncharacterized protein n=1 Tax=Saccharomonospora xinjiangensis XJ-54 TaxID=882086 RepID=I0V6G3_9PSEU|nr:hypothetical protein SacxiDRAFT_3517 [Saccharomonospora xinjiangensis XJ-54]
MTAAGTTDDSAATIPRITVTVPRTSHGREVITDRPSCATASPCPIRTVIVVVVARPMPSASASDAPVATARKAGRPLPWTVAVSGTRRGEARSSRSPRCRSTVLCRRRQSGGRSSASPRSPQGRQTAFSLRCAVPDAAVRREGRDAGAGIPRRGNELDPREREVPALMAKGRSNPGSRPCSRASDAAVGKHIGTTSPRRTCRPPTTRTGRCSAVPHFLRTTATAG